ncbi:hypothetical protein TthSNM11_02850 [Thermus thermophilus]|nr:hypothetical protein TthSNM11_02850 [Thermus thermophilus]
MPRRKASSRLRTYPTRGMSRARGQAKATPERRTTAWARPMAWREKPKASRWKLRKK